MLLPTDFLLELEPESVSPFLDSLVVAAAGADGYAGDLRSDREALQAAILAGRVRVEFSEEEGTFRLLTAEEARHLTTDLPG